MPFARKSAEPARRQGEPLAKGSDLLIRFFESEWFDAFIALTYLYKNNTPGVLDYLCNRLYTLPERDVERYLSQLTQLAIQRGPNSSLGRVIVGLCAQSLRIAVKAYWLLLAISQDHPKDAQVVALRDACEQAALEGHWQLPFKQSRLPPPLSASPVKRRADGGRTPLLLSPSDSFSARRSRSAGGLPLSPDGDSRPMSPDGLGGGLYSSVFMDTGVEGLIYSSPPPELRREEEPRDLRAIRQQVASSPRDSQGALLGGPGRPLLPLRVDAQRVSSLQEELGAGEGVSALLLRSATAGDGGKPGVVQQSEPAPAGGNTANGSLPGGAGGLSPAASLLLSPPSSPRRRQTTFGATLDFVETLCQASSSLTAFQPDDRQWALRKALQQINVEIEKASRNGVAIWFPMGEANLRVVRLAPRESRLLNSREKAPFTLCVEVLDEAEAAAAAELRAAAQAAAAAAAAAAQPAVHAKPAAGAGSYADSAKSLLVEAAPAPAVPAVEDEGAAAAAAEAAAHGIRFVANHHRTLSMETVSTSSSAADAAALAAVQGSSATTGDAVAAARALQQPAAGARGSSRSSFSSIMTDGQSEGMLASEPSFAGMLQAGGSPAGKSSPSVPLPGSSSSPSSPELPRPRRLTDELDAVSDVPSFSESGSGALGSPLTGSGDSPLGLSGLSSPCSVSFEPSPPQQRGAAPAAPADQQLQRLTALSLPGKASGKQPGAGTWIGGSMSPPPAAQRQLQAERQQQQQHAQQQGSGGTPKRSSSSGCGGQQQATVASSLDRALAGLRGEAPLVTVQFEVLNDRPLSSARSSASGAADQHGTPRSVDSGGSGSTAAAAAAAGRRRASLDAARRVPHQCDNSSWACKLGLCKLCNAKLATMGDEEDEPFVRVHFTVQGGVDLTVRKPSARHQRMPSDEAILKVAKQHKLPAPELPGPLAAPQQQRVLQQHAQPPAPAATQQAAAGGLVAPAAGPAAAGSAPVPSCMPLLLPASGSCSPVAARRDADAERQASGAAVPASAEAQQQREAAQAVYGEPWQARKARVQAASPHGRRPGWDLRCVIVKTGDDCRQELLAMQLIRAFHEIFAEAQLPLWLRPYEVLPTSNRTALIEVVPNAPSIHALKSKCPPGTSLRDHLLARHGGAGTPSFLRAQRCFAESLAAYSLVCYLLQIKDRHNGNILLDDEGHLIHIDFGFMLSNSPGGVNFESAPFKLTRELLEVLDSDSEGRASEPFDYFKVLMIQGFLALRKHADRILLLVEMMQNSGCPCFKSRVAAVQGLKKRFHLALPEPQVVEVVLGLISSSLDAWRTRQYDYYQRVLNGIL
ncbi:hypothetical protein ABPG75_012317 [Micractinium tetrahymenae]